VNSKSLPPAQPPPFFTIKVDSHTVTQAANSKKFISFRLNVSCPAGKWTLDKTYSETEVLSAAVNQAYSKLSPLPKFAHFEPFFFGSPDYPKVQQAVEKNLQEIDNQNERES